MATLTSANSRLALVVTNLFPTSQNIQGYSTDDMFRSAVARTAETMMGVDGILSGGWVAVAKMLNVSLQADSPSNLVFEQWYNAQQEQREVLIAQVVLTMPAISQSYRFTQGYLTGYPPITDARRLLQPRVYEMTFQEIIGTPI